MKPVSCDQLEEYLSGELSPSDRQRFTVHLARCPSCADEVAWAGSLHRWLGDAPPATPPVQLMRQVESRLIWRRRRQLLVTYGLAASVLFVAVAATTWYLQPRDFDRRSDQGTPAPIAANGLRAAPDAEAEAGPVYTQTMGVRWRGMEIEARDAILIPARSERPDTLFVWVHPTVPLEDLEEMNWPPNP